MGALIKKRFKASISVAVLSSSSVHHLAILNGALAPGALVVAETVRYCTMLGADNRIANSIGGRYLLEVPMESRLTFIRKVHAMSLRNNWQGIVGE